MILKSIESLGYNEWFASETDGQQSAAHDIARVLSVHKDRYVISKGEGESFAELSGNMFYTTNNALDLPTTGDWVFADFYDDDTHAIIHGLIPRKSLLTRKTAGKTVDHQMIAANIDVAFIMQSANENLNFNRLERYLVMVNECAITPVIILSKCDLISQQRIAGIKASIIKTSPQTKIITCSALLHENIEAIHEVMKPGCTYCLIGSSGVGKTTLLNCLLGDTRFETQTVSSKESKGKHTTTSRSLISLDNGVMIIDTPGMRELGNIATETGLEETFSEITEIIQQCKFSNCSHSNEKGCAVIKAIKEGVLDKKRYKNFAKLQKESEFNEMSYHEKRNKDKQFGKLIKSTLKNKHKF